MTSANLDLSSLRESVSKTFAELEEAKQRIEELQSHVRSEMDARLDALKISDVDPALLEDFLKEPYVIIPRRADEWYVIAPKWLNFSVGWLDRSTRSYNIFIVNRYVQWLSDIPALLRDKLKFERPLPVTVFDGIVLTGKDHQEAAAKVLGSLVLKREGADRLRLKKGYEFDAIAALIRKGTLPFRRSPVLDEDVVDPPAFPEAIGKVLSRKYVQEAWAAFREWGALGVYWAFGAGKSLFALYALSRVKGPKLIVVPSLTLLEQWQQRLQAYCPKSAPEVTVATYQSYEKVKNGAYSLVVFEECHHLPANTFCKLSTLRTKYRIGLSGSPFREDGRQDYIIALTGKPVGMDWEELIKMQAVRVPVFKLYIVKDNKAKVPKLQDFLRTPAKTLIFCDSLDQGEYLSREFGIPFVYGETRDRLEILAKSQAAIVSRVGDEGVSLPDIERVIEVSFLFGSKMQESQRYGRLMHSKSRDLEHIIIMTEDEYQAYGKRLNAITERGFGIEVFR